MNQPFPAQSSGDRICALVLGMHRSGTSALTRVLSLLGCDLPATLMGANKTNEAGHWESTSIARLNDDILESAGSVWNDWLAFNPGWYASPKAAEFKERALALLEEEFGASRLFVLKDPRICRLAPFWLDVLAAAGIRPAILMPFRNPLEVSASLAKRNGFEPEFGHLLWLRHVLDAEAATRHLPRFHCSFDDLMAGWPRIAGATQEALGISWPRMSPMVSEEIGAFLTDGLRHHREAPRNVADNPLLSAWLRESYGVFLRWADGGEAPEDHATLDRIRADLDAAAPAFARLISAGNKASQQVHALEKDIGEARVALAEKQQAADEMARRLEEARGENGALQSAAAELKATLDDMRGQLSHAQSALAQRSAEADEVTGQLRAAETRLREVERAAQEAAARAERLAGEQDRAQAELKSLRAEKANVEARLSERFREIATITRLLGEQESATRLSTEQATWLRDVSAMMLGGPDTLKARLRALLPASTRRARLHAALKRQGLFDADAYLAAYPDVAAAGMDPLFHYVNHGMAEGRERAGV